MYLREKCFLSLPSSSWCLHNLLSLCNYELLDKLSAFSWLIPSVTVSLYHFKIGVLLLHGLSSTSLSSRPLFFCGLWLYSETSISTFYFLALSFAFVHSSFILVRLGTLYWWLWFIQVFTRLKCITSDILHWNTRYCVCNHLHCFHHCFVISISEVLSAVVLTWELLLISALKA